MKLPTRATVRYFMLGAVLALFVLLFLHDTVFLAAY